jgi:hypothetical protein
MSALASIVASLGELSESELRQLYLMVGVRLGIPDVPGGAKPRKQATGKTGKAKPSGSKTAGSAPSSKGNPKRKSQWANHPLYQEYSRLKKVVESQAKEAKTSFNGVDSSEARAYRQAFSQWLDAKSSFRGHGESGQDRVKPGEKKKEDEEESSEEEEGGEAPSTSKVQAKPAPPPAPPAGSGKSRSPSGKGKSSSK